MKSDYNNQFLDKLSLFVEKVYKLTDKYPKIEQYCLTSQLRRAVLSITANVHEGYARQSTKEFIQYLSISLGLLAEVKYFLEFSKSRKYISNEEFIMISSLSEEVGKMLWTSREKLKKKLIK